MEDELLSFYKALADANRLKILGLLARQPYSVEQLAALLALKPATISHHLSRLAGTGLVSARVESYYNVYRLEEKALEEKARRLLSRQDLQAVTAGIDVDAYDRKVIADFTRRDGSLKTIPAQRKKLEAILRYIVRAFAPGRQYSERRVNEILRGYHEDTATLRRALVDFGLMRREGGGGNYWRVTD